MSVNRFDITYVRTGAFSGSALSLQRALRAHVDLLDVDLYTYARRPELWHARFRAIRESRREGGVPWAKTGAWARANQRLIERRFDPWRNPAVIVQTMCAMVPPHGSQYVVYTDRVGLEPAVGDPALRRRSTTAWSDREHEMLTHARHVFVMGLTTKAALEELYAIDPRRASVVGAAPNFRLTSRPPSATSHRLLFVGTQWRRKGGPELLDAFAEAVTADPQLSLTIVGCRPTCPLPPNVSVLGRVDADQMNAIYDNADILFLPTRSEPFGIAFVEALQKGLPCIATSIGNVPTIIGNAGIVAPLGDTPALIAALRTIRQDYARFARAASKRGEELSASWSWDNIATQILRSFA